MHVLQPILNLSTYLVLVNSSRPVSSGGKALKQSDIGCHGLQARISQYTTAYGFSCQKYRGRVDGVVGSQKGDLGMARDLYPPTPE